MSLISRLNEQPASTVEKLDLEELAALIKWLKPLTGEVWDLRYGVYEARLSNNDVGAAIYIPTRFPYRSPELKRRVAAVLRALGWERVTGPIRCHKGNPPERGYRRPVKSGASQP